MVLQRFDILIPGSESRAGAGILVAELRRLVVVLRCGGDRRPQRRLVVRYDVDLVVTSCALIRLERSPAAHSGDLAFPFDLRLDLRAAAVFSDRRKRTREDVADRLSGADACRSGLRHGIHARRLRAVVVLLRDLGAAVGLRMVGRVFKQRMRLRSGRHTDVGQRRLLRIVRIDRALGYRAGGIGLIIAVAPVPIPEVGGCIRARGRAVVGRALMDVALGEVRLCFRRLSAHHRADPFDVIVVCFTRPVQTEHGVLVLHMDGKAGVVVQRTHLRPRIGLVALAADRVGQRPFDGRRTVRRRIRLERTALDRPRGLAGGPLRTRRQRHTCVAARERDVFDRRCVRRRDRRLDLTLGLDIAAALIVVGSVCLQILRDREDHGRTEYIRRRARYRRRSAADHGKCDRHRGEDHRNRKQHAERTLDSCHT